jgi:2-keto-3-deoxy-L-fuconate dehydrogenase
MGWGASGNAWLLRNDTNMSRLKDKIAVVTAAGQGIGRATAELFAAQGAHVIAVDINAAALATLAGMKTRCVDLTNGTAIEELARDVGGVDILFNCAGFVHAGTLLTTEEADFDFSFTLNVKSVYRMIRQFLPGMIARGGGSIINMASVVSSIIGAPNRFVYGASKAAVIGLTKSVAMDFVKQGIRCNVICPGTVQSPSLDARLAATVASPWAGLQNRKRSRSWLCTWRAMPRRLQRVQHTSSTVAGPPGESPVCTRARPRRVDWPHDHFLHARFSGSGAAAVAAFSI